MAEATAPATQAEPKLTANNIAKAVTDRATGRTPTGKGPDVPDGDEKKPAAQVDPNAGKEKYTVEGRDVYLTPAEARAYVQKGIAFEPRISELARMRQEIQQFEQALTDNPGMIIANLAKAKGIPLQNLVEKVLSSNASEEVKEATGRWYWENVAKRHKMDPKDLENLELKEENDRLKATEKEKSDAAIAEQNRSAVARALATVSAQIQETLGELGIKDINSPAAIRITKDIADVMRVSYMTKQPLTAKLAAEKVKARIQDYQRQFYDTLDPEQLVTAIGKENAEKVRKFLLKTVQDAEKGTQQEGGKQFAQPPRRDQRKTINMDQFHDMLDDLKKNSK